MKKVVPHLGFILFLASCVYTPAIKGPEGQELPYSIASLESVDLNGVEQWILIRGEDTSKPVLLFLHGGPGFAEMTFYRFNPGLEKDFVLVMWDQRGAGKSYSRKIPEETMTIEQFIADTHKLTQILKKRFGRDKIYLAGHSWGTMLGMLTIDRHPTDYYAYIGIAQYVLPDENERISWEFCLNEARKRGNKKAIKQLEKVGPPVNGDYKGDYNKNGKLVMKGVRIQRKWLTKYDGFWVGKTGYGFFLKTLLTTKEYTLGESLKFFRGSEFSMRTMWPDMVKVNLEKDVPEVKIPVYFCVGRHDYTTPGEISYPYYEMLKAPKKDFFWFERSAHFPCFEEPEDFNKVMEKIVKETYTP